MKKEMTKKWYQSKTLWINILAIIAGIATGIQGQITTGAPLTVAGIINLILRVVSKHEIEF